jgi:excinuclease UvrABC nuclease subunit
MLIQEFGSVQGVRDAGEEAIAKLPGFNADRARKLLASLAATSPV